jgi:hypothetical protein
LRRNAGKVVEVQLDGGGRVTDMRIVSSLEKSYLPPSAGSRCSYGDENVATMSMEWGEAAFP